jgi:hypothetical protein
MASLKVKFEDKTVIAVRITQATNVEQLIGQVLKLKRACNPLLDIEQSNVILAMQENDSLTILMPDANLAELHSADAEYLILGIENETRKQSQLVLQNKELTSKLQSISNEIITLCGDAR